MTREASAAMRAHVEAFDTATCAEHEMDLRRKFFGDDWSQDVVDVACASRTALLAAIAAQEAATEDATNLYAELAREASEDAAFIRAIGARLGARDHGCGGQTVQAGEQRYRRSIAARIDELMAQAEAAQAEVARLRKAITYIADACVVAMRLSDAIGLDAGAMPEIERDLRAALKETP